MTTPPLDAPIVLVEDDEDDVFFMQRALAEAGVRRPLEVFRDAAAGRERVCRAPLPLIVFLDLKLPRGSGFEVLERAAELHCPVVTIVLTSSSEPRDVERAYRAGAHAYLVKPPAYEELVKLVASVRSFWFERNVFCPWKPGSK